MSHAHEWNSPPRREPVHVLPGQWYDGDARSCPTSREYGCAYCDETSAICNACGKATGSSLLACEQCITQHRSTLEAIADALGWWRHAPASPVKAVRYDRAVISGDRSRAEAEITHPRDVVEVLWSWADLWGEQSGAEPEGEVHQWLIGRLMWAIHQVDASVWFDFSAELRPLLAATRSVAGLTPETRGPCMYCGGKLVQDWADGSWRPNADGLSDVVRCTGCHVTFPDRPSQLRATKGALRLAPDHEPDALVNIEDARLIFADVPLATWRKWNQRDHERAEQGRERKMPERGWDPQGRPLYRLADLAVLVEARRDLKRPGRRAS